MTREEAVDAIFTAASVDAADITPTIPIGAMQLWVFCNNEYQRELCRMPGRDVCYIPGVMTKEQWLSNNPAYIDGLLVQSRGLPVQTPCNLCLNHTGPFRHCVQLAGYYGNICGNCKYRKMDAECSFRAGGEGNPATCSWVSFLQNETAPISVSPISELFYDTECMLGNPTEDFIIIPDDTWNDSGIGSSLESRRHTSSEALAYSSSSPAVIHPCFQTAYAVFVPPIPSIEEDAGSSFHNPVLIQDEETEMSRAGTENGYYDEDFIINIVDDKNEDPDYSQYSSSDDEIDP